MNAPYQPMGYLHTLYYLQVLKAKEDVRKQAEEDEKKKKEERRQKIKEAQERAQSRISNNSKRRN